MCYNEINPFRSKRKASAILLKGEAGVKTHKAVYAENSVTYWPHFGGAVGGICFAGIMMLAAFVPVVLELCWGENNIGGYLIFALLVTSVYAFLPLLAVKVMHTKISFSHEGVSVCNKTKRETLFVAWDAVRAIYYVPSGYRRERFEIYLKEPLPNKKDTKKYDYAIMINAVDIKKLEEFIPSKLYFKIP